MLSSDDENPGADGIGVARDWGVRVAQVRIQPERIPEAIRIYKEQVIPALEGQHGFGSALLLTQPESGRGISITFWETEKDRTAGEVGGFYQAQLAHFAGMFTETPVREAYVVAAKTKDRLER